MHLPQLAGDVWGTLLQEVLSRQRPARAARKVVNEPHAALLQWHASAAGRYTHDWTTQCTCQTTLLECMHQHWLQKRYEQGPSLALPLRCAAMNSSTRSLMLLPLAGLSAKKLADVQPTISGTSTTCVAS